MLYAAILNQGVSLGGIQKKVVSVINKESEILALRLEENKSRPLSTEKGAITWEELIKNFTLYENDLDKIKFPPIRISVTSKNNMQVKSAEQRVMFVSKRNRKKSRRRS